jgi:hypothetical protein
MVGYDQAVPAALQRGLGEDTSEAPPDDTLVAYCPFCGFFEFRRGDKRPCCPSCPYRLGD